MPAKNLTRGTKSVLEPSALLSTIPPPSTAQYRLPLSSKVTSSTGSMPGTLVPARGPDGRFVQFVGPAEPGAGAAATGAGGVSLAARPSGATAASAGGDGSGPEPGRASAGGGPAGAG